MTLKKLKLTKGLMTRYTNKTGKNEVLCTICNRVINLHEEFYKGKKNCYCLKCYGITQIETEDEDEEYEWKPTGRNSWVLVKRNE